MPTRGRGSTVAVQVIGLLAVGALLWSLTLTSTMRPPKLEATTLRTTTKSNPLRARGEATSYQLALQQSYGFFTDIPDDEWKERQQQAQYLARHQHRLIEDGQGTVSNVNDRTTRIVDSSLWFSQNYEPIFACPRVRRVGGVGDGPKWTCDPHRIVNQETETTTHQTQPPCLIYSIGSGGKLEFERGIQDLLGNSACEIHIFDPGSPEKTDGNIHYHRLGLKSSYDARYKPMIGGIFKSLPEIVQQLGHEGRKIDIFKMDCEGCEYYVVKDIVANPKLDVQQVLVETHDMVYAGATAHFQRTDFYETMQKNNFVLFYKEGNLQAKGSCVEWAYIKMHPDFLALDK